MYYLNFSHLNLFPRICDVTRGTIAPFVYLLQSNQDEVAQLFLEFFYVPRKLFPFLKSK